MSVEGALNELLWEHDLIYDVITCIYLLLQRIHYNEDCISDNLKEPFIMKWNDIKVNSPMIIDNLQL